MKTKYLSSLILGLIFLSHFSVAQDKWIWEEAVVFKESHDPRMIVLDDGRGLEYAGEKAFEKVDTWNAGKKLSLVYNTQKGLNLLDSTTGNLVNITNGLETHPIDLLCKICLDKESTTNGLAACYYEALKVWDYELNRVYQQLIARSSETEKKKLRATQLKWIAFRNAQIEFMNELYYSDDCGSICKINRASAMRDLTRSQAIRLNSFIF